MSNYTPAYREARMIEACARATRRLAEIEQVRTWAEDDLPRCLRADVEPTCPSWDWIGWARVRAGWLRECATPRRPDSWGPTRDLSWMRALRPG